MDLISALPAFGADDTGGVSRVGFGSAETEARDYLASLASRAGLLAEVDFAGNLIVKRDHPPTSRPVLLIGSHLDSVVGGGHLDGAYGVAAAFEVIRTLDAHDVPMRHEPVMIAFANEEGARFPQPFWGSMAVIGGLTQPQRAVDVAGLSLRGPLAAAGGDLDRVQEAAWPAGSIAAFLELHIEQGPVLARQGCPIGVVEGIVGRTLLDIEVLGRQNHAGTTPMRERADALVAAAQLVLAVREIAEERDTCMAATVGSLRVHPNVPNVVPGQVNLTVEIRDLDASRLDTAESAVMAAVHHVRCTTGTSIRSGVALRVAPVETDMRIREAIASAAADLTLPFTLMPSGAGHDAQIIARAAPIGMIFVPSRAGISHAPAEFTEERHLVAGADVLMQAVLRTSAMNWSSSSARTS